MTRKTKQINLIAQHFATARDRQVCRHILRELFRHPAGVSDTVLVFKSTALWSYGSFSHVLGHLQQLNIIKSTPDRARAYTHIFPVLYSLTPDTWLKLASVDIEQRTK